MPSQSPRVLVVEDEANIRELVSLHLGLENLAPVGVADGSAALELTKQERFSLIVLDVMLPGLDGVTLCRALRRDSLNRDTPVLMLTARQEESDTVVGLDAGADDYVTKPFGVRELMARVRALLRRGTVPSGRDHKQEAPLTYRDITVDPLRRHVSIGGRSVELTAHEFQLLHVLLSSPGIVFTRDALLQRVWSDDTFVTDRSVDTLVKRLRRKIEADPGNPSVILTVWGTGYKAGDV